MSHHPDPLDLAADLTQMFNDHALEKARANNKAEQVQNEDGSWPVVECVECDDDIPEARLALGKIRCVTCQSRLERSSAQYARN